MEQTAHGESSADGAVRFWPGLLRAAMICRQAAASRPACDRYDRKRRTPMPPSTLRTTRRSCSTTTPSSRATCRGRTDRGRHQPRLRLRPTAATAHDAVVSGPASRRWRPRLKVTTYWNRRTRAAARSAPPARRRAQLHRSANGVRGELRSHFDRARVASSRLGCRLLDGASSRRGWTRPTDLVTTRRRGNYADGATYEGLAFYFQTASPWEAFWTSVSVSGTGSTGRRAGAAGGGLSTWVPASTAPPARPA